MNGPITDKQSTTDASVPSEESTMGATKAELVAGGNVGDPLQDAAMMDRIAGRLFGEGETQTRVGRFVLGEIVGSGAMGVVHSAFDETLDRKVAIKLILEERTQSEDAQSRLLREAQAMARVSHAHVIPVYEAGSYPGGVFVAMEYVEGGTLRAWLAKNRARAWSEKLRVLLGAGQGLAAAHREGIIHRDFKPDNVMVTGHDVPKVGDFGLAGFATTPAAATEGDTSSSQGTLTQTGAVVGTPVYMPPERFEAKPATEQSDQFAFCVVVFEALFGVRPFPGKNAAELTANVLQGSVRATPSSSGVPRYVKAAVLRGLATDPSERWPSMDALLVALKPRTRGPTWLAVAGVVALASTAVFVSASADDEPCGNAAAHMDGLWDEPRRTEMAAAYTERGSELALGAWAQAGPRVDDYADAWVEAHTRNCEMTRVSAEQSEAVMELRMGCLRRAKLGFAASLDVLSAPDADVVANADRLVSSLPDLQRCEDVEGLERGGQAPSEADAAQVDIIVGLVATSRALRLAGKYEEAMAAARDARNALSTVAYGPVATDVALALGNAHLAQETSAEAVPEFLTAQHSAMRHGQWEDAVEAAGLAAFALGGRDTRFDEAHLALALAEGLAERVGSQKVLAYLESRRASVYSSEGRYDESIAAFESSLQRWAGSAAFGDEGRLTARRSLAITFERAQRYAEAEAQMREVVAGQIAALGPKHPRVAGARKTLAGILARQRRLDEAEVEFAAAREILEATLPGHPSLAQLRVSAAAVPLHRGQFEEAARLYEEIIAEWGPKLGLTHDTLIGARSNLAGALVSAGHYDKAANELRDLVDARVDAVGEDHPRTIAARSNLTEILLVVGDLEGAEAQGRRALAAALAHDPKGARVGNLRGKLGSIYMDQGRPIEALAEYEAGRDVLVAALDKNDPAIATLRNNLGHFLMKQERHAEAGHEFTEALRIMEAAGVGDHPAVAQTLVNLARVDLQAGEVAPACGKLERAVKINAGASSAPGARGEARFVLAQCLAKLGGDKTRIAALTNATLDDYAQVPAELSSPWLPEVESFMTKHAIKRRPAG